MHDESSTRAGALLAEAWRAGATITSLPPGLAPRTRPAAYRTQDEMARRVGLAVGGWKIGAASRGLMRDRGLDGPIPGRVFESLIFTSPARLPAARYPFSNLECEFALRTRKAFPVRDAPYTAHDVAGACVLHAAIEVTATRYAEPATGAYGPPDLYSEIADNGSAGALVLGPAVAQWRGLDTANMGVALRVDDGEPPPNLLGDYRVDPLEVMVWTVNMARERGLGMPAGTVVSTGSATEPVRLPQGGAARAVFDGLAVLEVASHG